MKTAFFADIRRFAAAAGIAMLLVAGVGSPVNAALQVTLTVSGVGSTTIVDNVGLDTDATPNQIAINSTVFGGYTFSLTAASGNSPGSASDDLAFLSFNVNSILRSSGAAATTVTVVASSDAFVNPSTTTGFDFATSNYSATLIAANGVANQSNASVGYNALLDNGPISTVHTDFLGSDSVLGTSGPTPILAPSGAASSATGFVPVFLLTTPFALTVGSYVTFDNAGGQNARLDGNATLYGPGNINFPTPEPASFAMWGLGVFGLAAFRSFRSRKQVA